MRKLAGLLLSLAWTATLAAEAPAKFTVGAYEFTRPAEWTWVEPKSPMRKAQLQIAGKEGARPADVTFFFFGSGQGGDVNANVQRWLGQFTSKPEAGKTEPLEIKGAKVTLVSTEGTMKASPFGGQPEDQPDSALLGAIVEHAEGAVFVKMTGPTALVKESRAKFMAMLGTLVEKK